MKANILMDQMFDVNYVHLCEADNVVDSIVPTESLRDLILQFYTNKYSQSIWSVVTWLKPGHVPLIVSQDFC